MVNGIASPRLLDSYSDERVFAARENLSYGMKSTEFMAPPSFAFDLMRTAVLGLAERHAAVRPLINPRQTHAIAYENSPLNIAAHDADAFRHGPMPGTVLPECRLLRHADDGTPAAIHLTDLLGPRFTALLFDTDAAHDDAWRQLQRTLADKRIAFQTVKLTRAATPGIAGPYAIDQTGRLHDMLDATPGTVYLIRPDGHVLARWRNGSADATLRALNATLTPQ